MSANIRDIAAAGVSTATVSRTISEPEKVFVFLQLRI
jgi:DNA-binding LacI/PurR family transcriptional regulator